MTRFHQPLSGEESLSIDGAGPPAHLLTVDEVAQRLRIGRSTAYRLCHQGRLPTLLIGKAVRVPSDARDEWLRRNVRSA